MKYTLTLFTFIVCLMPTIAQTFEYKLIAFQSTSTLQLSGSSYSSTPTINEYGIATCNETTQYSPNKVGPRKNPGTPGGNPEIQQPIGDTPVILFIVLIGLYIAYKKWKRIQSLSF